MTPIFIQYAKCGTCQKAAKWLREHQIEVQTRDIVTQNPTAAELSEWIPRSGVAATKFFNTSGLRYKELNLKDVVRITPQEELIQILAREGMLVKRPVLITDRAVLVGFKEEQWAQELL